MLKKRLADTLSYVKALTRYSTALIPDKMYLYRNYPN